MDQTAICMSQSGAALHVSFDPLRAVPLQLPSSLRLCVLQSRVECLKVASAPTRFNRRVFECKVGAILIHNSHVLASSPLSPPAAAMITLKQLQSLCKTEDLLPLLDRSIENRPYSKDELVELCGWGVLEGLLGRVGRDVWDMNTDFEPYKRVKHVMEETRRTQRFKDVCEDSSIRESAKMQILGQLIDEAHASMSGSFEASCPEIDSLAAAARRHGALGARVFGAGWGGCVLAVLSPELEADFVQVMSAYPGAAAVFPSLCSGGARVFDTQGAILKFGA
eukprot:Polyplicarium_translucidae@DN3329_c1_g1_i6.p2